MQAWIPSLTLLLSLRKLRQGPQGSVPNLIGQLFRMQEAEYSFKVWVTDGTLPQ